MRQFSTKFKYILVLFIVGIIFNISINKINAQVCKAESDYDQGALMYIQFMEITQNGNQIHYSEDGDNGNIYNDYTQWYQIDLKSKESYEFYVLDGNAYDYDQLGIWIDWNQDSQFDASTEFIKAERTQSIPYTWDFRGVIDVPADAAPGLTTMRLRLMYDFDGQIPLEPCGDYFTDNGFNFYGEVEDYTINVIAPVEITSQPVGATSLCTSTTTTRSLSVSTTGSVSSYQWQRLNAGVWQNVNGFGSTYNVSIPSGLLTTSTNPLTYSADFRVIVYGQDGGSETSNAVTLTAYSPATLSITNANPQNPCQASNLTLRANLGGSFTGLMWQKLNTSTNTWVDLSLTTYPTANTRDLQMNNLSASESGTYRCKVNNVSSCNSGSLISANINVNVVSLFQVTSSPPANIVGCVDSNPITLNVETQGTILGYTWKRNGSPLTNNNGYQTKQITIFKPQLQDAGVYTCDISYADCAGQFVRTTTPANVQIFSTFSINEQPKEVLVCEKQNAAISVVAVGSVYSYQWQKDGVNLTLKDNPYANSSILYFDNANHKQSGVYRCAIDAEDCGNGRVITYTNDVVVYVKRGTEILEAHKNISAPLGGIATMSIQAHVAPIPPKMIVDIQWYKGTTPLVDNNRIAGAKSSLLTVRNLQASDFANDYWVVVKGLCTSDTAKGFEIKESKTPTITVNSLPSVTTVCEGKTANLTVDAIINTGETLNYQWYSNGNMLSDGARYTGTKTNSLTVVSALPSDEIDNYEVIISNSSNTANALFNGAKLNVINLVTLVSKSDTDITAAVDKSINLFANFNSELPLSYKWFRNGIEIAGETKNTLDITNATTQNAGLYSIEIISQCETKSFEISNVAVALSGALSVERDNLDLNISPNPTSNTLNINLEGINYNYITITNTLGSVVYSSNNNLKSTKLLTLDINYLNLSNGIYFVNVSGSKSYFGKFVVNK